MFGMRLKYLREQNNILQKDLAKKLKITQQTISLYESGNREPDYETLKKIADYFNVSTDYLLGQTDELKPHHKTGTINISNKKTETWFEKFIRLMKDQRGAMAPEFLPLLLMETAKIYAVSKGIPPSLMSNHISQIDDLSDEEKEQLVNQIDAILEDDSYETDNDLAVQIHDLSPEGKNAVKAVIDALKINEESAVKDDYDRNELIAANRKDNPMDDLPSPAKDSVIRFKKMVEEKRKNKQ